MRSLFICLILLAAPLFADKITTIEDKSFEGIVTAFDKDKKLTLATGYGELSFTVATEVKDAAVADYTWPKSTSTKKPARDAKFEAWIKERDAKKIEVKKPTGLPEGWDFIADKKEENEVDIAKIVDPILEYKKVPEDQNESVKERKTRCSKVIEKINGKWAYVAFYVESVDEGYDGNITITLSGDMYDPRTGKSAGLAFRNGPTLTAEKRVNAKAVDEKNKTLMKDEGNGVQWSSRYFIDYARAEEIKKGDAIVFKLTPAWTTDSEDWHREFVRVSAKMKLVKKAD